MQEDVTLFYFIFLKKEKKKKKKHLKVSSETTVFTRTRETISFSRINWCERGSLHLIKPRCSTIHLNRDIFHIASTIQERQSEGSILFFWSNSKPNFHIFNLCRNKVIIFVLWIWKSKRFLLGHIWKKKIKMTQKINDTSQNLFSYESKYQKNDNRSKISILLYCIFNSLLFDFDYCTHFIIG